MVKSKKVSDATLLYSLKKCPYCHNMLKLDANRCDGCKNRVGAINKAGFAQKLTNWKAYVVSALAWTAFCVYIWWAFFKE